VTVVIPDIGLGCANIFQATLPEFIELAEKAGFRRMTARPYAFGQALESGWSEAALQSRLADAGMTVTMIDGLSTALPGTPLPSELDPNVRARMPPDVLYPPSEEMCFRAATALGASIVNVAHYMGRPLPVDVLADALAGVCQRAAPLGLTICLEFFPDSGVPDLAVAQSIVEACGEANVGVLLDVFHLDRSGGTVDDVRRLPPGALPGIQLSDRRRTPPGTAHVPMSGRELPGDGELPLRDLIEAGLQNSPDATLDLEVLNDELRSLSAGETAARLGAAAAAWRATMI
jgi:sugar phosphate isomerase/epimerase